MTQALRQAVSDYFSQTDVVRIFAKVYAGNFASMRALEKAGFRKTGIYGMSLQKCISLQHC